MDKKNAIAILNSRASIVKPGKYRVKVSNCGDYHKELANGQQVVAIANFAAMTPYQKGKAIDAIKADDLNGALNNNLSLSIRDSDYRPAKGERVDIDVDYVTTKDGEQALLVVGLTPVQAESTSKCDFSALLEEGEEAEATADADPTEITAD